MMRQFTVILFLFVMWLLPACSAQTATVKGFENHMNETVQENMRLWPGQYKIEIVSQNPVRKKYYYADSDGCKYFVLIERINAKTKDYNRIDWGYVSKKELCKAGPILKTY